MTIELKSVPVDKVHEQVAEVSAPADLVSVCVSLFNYERFLRECLDSVRAQHHDALELIVVDDASDKDDSLATARAWLQSHAQRFHRTLLLSHVTNQGLAQARNTGFAHATGRHVFVLDADNTIYPRAIARLLETLSNVSAGAAYTQLEFFGDQRQLGVADIWDKERFARGNYVDAMALVSKEAWQQVGGYTHMEGGWEDFDFWCKFIDQGIEALFVPEVLCRYRVHGTSMLRTETNKAHERLAVQMALRHPWLRFGGAE